MAAAAPLESKQCRRCGAPLAGAELAGNCPRCLSALLLSPDAADAAEPSSSPILRRLGDYELLEEVARGGMGVVFRAWQVSLDRMVAVKVLRDAWLATPVQLKRFRAEAANAGKLKHPNIVAVHDVGEQGGQHYFAMDLIKWTNLAELTREGPLPPGRVAELVVKVAEALQHAHQQGVLHRDLKPSNVLIDAQGEPHVTDFGLGRLMDGESSLTVSGQVLGTPGYMAPEQAKGCGTVGLVTDVYGLGALLFHLLTGRAPFVGAGAAETLTQVLQQEPLSPRLLNPNVPVDLAAVCLKCLRKTPRERYGSAGEVAADLQRFLGNETTRARPAGVLERCARWARRKPALAALFVVVPFSLILGLTTTIWEWRQAEKQAKEAVRQRQNSERNELATGQSLYAADMNLVQQALAQQNLGRARVLLGLHAPQAGKRDLCGWEWWYFSKQCRGDDVFTLRPAGGKVTYLVASRHLNGVVAGREDGTVELWDLGAQRPVRPLLKETAAIHWLASDSEGRFLTTLTVQGPVKLWDMKEMTKIKLLRTYPTNFVHSLSARDHLVALTAVVPDLWPVPEGDFGLTGAWNWDTGEQVKILPESGAAGVFSPTGDLLATGSYKGSVKIWSVEDWSLRHVLEPTGRVINLAFSPNGETLVTCNWEGAVLSWDVGTGRYLGAFQGHSGRVFSAQFSPDGRMLATASADETIGLWDVATHRELIRLKGHEREVAGLAFSPDGKWIASGNSGDGTMRIWKTDPESHMNTALRGYSPPVFAPDNRTAASVNANGQVDLWDLERKQVKATLPSDPVESRLALETQHGILQELWLDPGRRRPLFGPREVSGVAVIPSYLIAQARQGYAVAAWVASQIEQMRAGRDLHQGRCLLGLAEGGFADSSPSSTGSSSAHKASFSCHGIIGGTDVVRIEPVSQGFDISDGLDARVLTCLGLKLNGLWRHADFLRLWSGQTLSVFGSTIGRTAMSFTAILFLHATPFEMGVLNVMQILPGFLGSLFAGAWVDRLRRRPLLIGADWGRAMGLSFIPLAALSGVLQIGQVYLVALVVSILTIIFDVAYESYLPGLVGKKDLVEGNSKLSGSAAIAEFGGASIAGWLVQAFSAPFTILIDAASFAVSAISVGMIRAREPAVITEQHPDMRREIASGLKDVWQMPLLRASALATLVLGLARGILGALVVLYMSRGLGFNPGLLGMIWAIGGVCSFIGATLAPRLTRRVGSGPAMILGLGVFGLSLFFIPLAQGASLMSALLLIVQQLGDGFFVVYEINQVSFRQAVTAERVLGRVNATFQFLNLGAILLGSLWAALLGEVLGVRMVLVLGCCCTLLAVLLLAASPLRGFRMGSKRSL